MKQIKVINITEEGRYGGPQKRICEVASRLKHLGVETYVIFPDTDSERFTEQLKDNGIHHYPLKITRLSNSKCGMINYLLSFIPEVFRIRKKIKQLNPDVVHCNGAYQVKGVIASKLAGVTSVWHMNDTQFTGIVMTLFKMVSSLFGDQYIGASKKALHHYKPNIEATTDNIIQAPIDTEGFDPNTIKASPLLEKSKKIKIITVGNINKIKGYDTLIKAVHIINSQYGGKSKIEFYVAGMFLDNLKEYTEGLMHEKEKLQLDNLFFLGGRRDVDELLSSADIYVCPSDFEASPISVWEAMSMGLPIVATDVGDVWEIFSIRESGYVVPTKDANAMAEKINELCMSKKSRVELGAKARETALDTLDLNICVKKHAKLYRDLTS